MSTKIYAGLALSDPQMPLFDAARRISRIVERQFHLERARLIATAIGEFVDDEERRAEAPPERTVFAYLRHDWLDRQAALSPAETFHDPLRFQIVFGQAASGRVLAFPLAACEGYREALLADGVVTDYGYWNNSDRPDELTEDQWEERRDDWDSILSPTGTLSHLPGWMLADSLVRVWNPINDGQLEDAYNPQRRRDIRFGDEVLAGAGDTADIYDLFHRVWDVTCLVEGYFTEHPEAAPLPTLPASLTRIRDLPGPYQPDEALVQLLRERLEQRLADKG